MFQAVRGRPAIATLIAVLAALLVLAITIAIAFGLYYHHAEALQEKHSLRGEGWWLSSGELERLKVVFWAIFGGSWVLSFAAGFGVTLLLQAPQVPAALFLAAVLALLAWPALDLLSFSNACNLGTAFPFDKSC